MYEWGVVGQVTHSSASFTRPCSRKCCFLFATRIISAAGLCVTPLARRSSTSLDTSSFVYLYLEDW